MIEKASDFLLYQNFIVFFYYIIKIVGFVFIHDALIMPGNNTNI